MIPPTFLCSPHALVKNSHLPFPTAATDGFRQASKAVAWEEMGSNSPARKKSSSSSNDLGSVSLIAIVSIASHGAKASAGATCSATVDLRNHKLFFACLSRSTTSAGIFSAAAL